MTPSPAELAAAVAALRAGEVVAFPTETVYGLGADARRPEAVRRIFAVKGRPSDHPLIVHIADAGLLDTCAAHVPEMATRLAAAFWPGPLTLILPRTQNISPVATGGLATVGLRVPAHPVARALLAAFGGPLAAPSANRFGAVSPTTAAHVRADLGDDVPVILDGGPCGVGVESTIVDLSGVEPRLLRPGGITREAIEALIGRPLLFGPGLDGAPRASGLLPSHYAPTAEVRLVSRENLSAEVMAADGRVGVLSFGPAGALPAHVFRFELPASADLAAPQLYAALREADQRGCRLLLATLPDETGVGAAIADRLRRAAGPRH